MTTAVFTWKVLLAVYLVYAVTQSIISFRKDYRRFPGFIDGKDFLLEVVVRAIIAPTFTFEVLRSATRYLIGRVNRFFYVIITFKNTSEK